MSLTDLEVTAPGRFSETFTIKENFMYRLFIMNFVETCH